MTSVEPAARDRRIATAAVGFGALVLRLPAIGRPSVLVFDELFYAPDAADLLRWGAEHGQPAHPELGKWLIAAGIRTFGFTPLGWRLASVIAGALLAAVICWTGARIADRVDVGIAAGSLVAFDGLVHVTSRLALLDVFVALAIAATMAATIAAWLAQPDARRARRCWWWSVAALSAGVAVKWSVATMAPLVLAVGLILARRLLPPGPVRRRAFVARSLAVAVLPVAAILLVVAPRQLGPDATMPAGYAKEQASVYRFHRDLRPTNANAASAWTWAGQSHPAVLYRAQDGADRVRIVAGANPVVWFVGLAGIALALVAALRGREVPALLLATVAAGWLPWLLSPRASYSFYAVVLVGPMVLCYLVGVAGTGRWRPWLIWVPVAAAAVAFVVLWSVWSAQPLPEDVMSLLTWWPGWSR